MTPKIHPYLASTEAAVLNGQGVARAAIALDESGFRPDIMIGNAGWGETLFLKDIWRDAPLLQMAEFYYRGRGSDVGFDPEFDGGRDSILRARARAGPHLLAIEAADAAYAPTEWQRQQFPEAHREKNRVIHDGIDCNRAVPDPSAAFALPDGRVLSRDDEVLTYVARNLEPYRGFHSLMRALPAILDARPEAQVVFVGGDEISYGARPGGGATWRETLLSEVGPLSERVRFLGRIPYQNFLRLCQISSVHAYLTYPFVLSWSMLEAMACGAFVVGSRTPPVEEVIREGENGWLMDFFDRDEIAERLSAALAKRKDMDALRTAARDTVVSRYELGACLAAQVALVDELVKSAQG